MVSMSCVFRDSFLFSDTLYNNIAIGKPGATKEEVYTVAKGTLRVPDTFNFLFDAWNSSVCMYSGCSRQRALIRDDNLDSDKSYSCDLAAVHIESDCINLRGYAGAGIGYKSDGAVRRIVNGNYYMSYMC